MKFPCSSFNFFQPFKNVKTIFKLAVHTKNRMLKGSSLLSPGLPVQDEWISVGGSPLVSDSSCLESQAGKDSGFVPTFCGKRAVISHDYKRAQISHGQ